MDARNEKVDQQGWERPLEVHGITCAVFAHVVCGAGDVL